MNALAKQVVSPASLDKLVLMGRYTEARDDKVSAWESEPVYLLSAESGHDICVLSEKVLQPKRKRRLNRNMKTQSMPLENLKMETVPVEQEVQNDNHYPTKHGEQTQRKLTLNKDCCVRQRIRHRTENSEPDARHSSKVMEVKFPPIYLSNFSHSPKAHPKSLIRKPKNIRISPEPLVIGLPPPPQHAVRQALLRRLKFNLKPDPFKLFRSKLLPYIDNSDLL